MTERDAPPLEAVASYRSSLPGLCTRQNGDGPETRPTISPSYSLMHPLCGMLIALGFVHNQPFLAHTPFTRDG